MPPLQPALWVFTAIVVVGIWAFAGYRIHVDHNAGREAVLQDTQNFSRTFEEHVVRTLQLADQAALYLKFQYEREGMGFKLSDWVRESQRVNTIFNLFTIVDDRGDVVMSSQEFRPVNLSDREHIRVHFEKDTGALFVGKPVLGRVSNKWSIQLTRRINKPDGSFGGVIVVSLDPFYFSSFYRDVNLGDAGLVSLVGSDGIVRARQTGKEASTGQDISGSEQFVRMSAQSGGNFVAASSIDGVERQHAFRRLADYPLYVVVGIGTREAMVHYYEVRRDTIVLASLFTLLAVAFMMVNVRVARRLEESREAALASNRAKSTFVANMSHELRTPLNGILGYAELLAEDLAGTEQAQYAGAIHASGRHLLEVVNDVLDVARIETGHMEVSLGDVDVRALVALVVDGQAAAAAKKGVALSSQLTADLPAAIRSDRTLVTRILSNLVNNAIKFTERGEVVVDVERVGDEVRFHVRDTGPGIPAGKYALIFERFSQVDSSEARRHEGTGLGLALSRELVQILGGRIWFQSAVGIGSTFSFALPIGMPQRDEVQGARPVARAAP